MKSAENCPAIAMNGVSAGYRGKDVLCDFTVSINRGEMVGVLGPNGAGKSTFLKAITGFAGITKGSIEIEGKALAEMSASERAGIVAVVPQEIETPMAFTVEEMVGIGRTARSGRFGGGVDDAHAVERAMAYTDVIDFRDRSIFELSGGERQRVIVAMALAQETGVILLDEATSQLDMNHRLEVLEIIERMNREKQITVVMVSHDLNLVTEFCGRILLMENGRLAGDGTPGEVLREDLLSRVYNCGVRVQVDSETGGVTVTPARRIAGRVDGIGKKIHIIAGGGSGESVMRRLVLCGYEVSCGVLNRGDSDAQTAAGLGVDCVLEKPFSPIGRLSAAESQKAMNDADAVVVCGVPFGSGNLINLELAETALSGGNRVYLMENVKERDYTAGCQAECIASRMLDSGAVVWKTVMELVDRLGYDLKS